MRISERFGMWREEEAEIKIQIDQVINHTRKYSVGEQG